MPRVSTLQVHMMLIKQIFTFAILLVATNAYCISTTEANNIAIGDTDTRIDALGKAMPSADDATAAFLQALADDAVKTSGGKAFVVKGDKALDPATGTALALPADAEDVINNNRMRGEIDSALAALKLFSKDDKVRQAAVKQLLSDADETKLPLIEKAWPPNKMQASVRNWGWCAQQPCWAVLTRTNAWKPPGCWPPGRP